MTPYILVVEDEDALATLLDYNLMKEGFRIERAADGEEALLKISEEAPDLVVLDWMLPKVSGVEVCRQIRAGTETRRTPVIMLTARSEEADKIRGLETGADDYVVKPFAMSELVARIRALLRRSGGEAHHVLKFAGTEVNIERRVVQRAGQEVKLTPAEYNLLVFFLQNPDRPLTRDVILNSVWGYNSFPHTRTVDAHIVKLRQKFEADPAAPRHFLTVHGIGYRFLP